MVEKVITPAPNVIDFVRYQLSRNTAGKMPALSARICRHCGAALCDDEREEECSSAFNFEAPGMRKLYAD
jgi:hypothetical protein